jgi:hypothetical protein
MTHVFNAPADFKDEFEWLGYRFDPASASARQLAVILEYESHV